MCVCVCVCACVCVSVPAERKRNDWKYVSRGSEMDKSRELKVQTIDIPVPYTCIAVTLYVNLSLNSLTPEEDGQYHECMEWMQIKSCDMQRFLCNDTLKERPQLHRYIV